MKEIKKYILILSGIFIFLFFITWQQISIFKMGYRVTKLNEQIRIEEIKNQQLIQKLHLKGSLFKIDYKSKKLFNMKIPDYKSRRILKVDSAQFLKKDRIPNAWVKYIKEIISPLSASAK